LVSEIEYDKWVDEYEAEIAKLKELQPCGHPVQAIRSTPYIGDQHSNYCGWCADIARFEREHELCQALTAELLEYRGRVARLQVEIAEERAQVATWMGVTKRAQADAARLREALKGILQAEDEAGCSFDEQGTDWPDIEVARAALSDTADDWLARHDAEVRAQERERCQWVALEHNAPELIEAARIIAAAIGEGE